MCYELYEGQEIYSKTYPPTFIIILFAFHIETTKGKKFLSFGSDRIS